MGMFLNIKTVWIICKYKSSPYISGQVVWGQVGVRWGGVVYYHPRVITPLDVTRSLNIRTVWIIC